MTTPLAIVTGSGGLIGSESVKHFVSQGYDVLGLENDMRAYFFGPEASTQSTTDKLAELQGFRSLELDIRDREAVENRGNVLTTFAPYNRLARETLGADPSAPSLARFAGSVTQVPETAPVCHRIARRAGLL